MTIPTTQHSAAIAIIGMAGRFPNAPDVDMFWENLERGVESLVEFSEEELLESRVPRALIDNPNYVKKGTLLEEADWFDAAFFGFNPREAEVLDPQHRIFLECAWQAMEDAGYGGEARPGTVGVYAGASLNSYATNVVLANAAVVEAVGGYQLMIASDKDFLATRVSYKLNLKGPSLTVQTACSTSLVAVQVASQALLARQCDMALAGGVSVGFPQKAGYLYSEGMIFSPDGECRPFDAEGRGIRAGQGAGIVVLKRLEDALRDGDSIRAVILGGAVNNDGAARMGYSAPSVEGQSEVISAALEMAGVNPESITYIEAHGTGTRVGDPIEIASLERAFRARTSKKQFCAVGAVKSNIGHLDAAAGVAGLIKTILALQHHRIPPTLHFRTPNPTIDFANSPFYVNATLSEWNANGTPRRAGISSFGIGGTNAHLVLEEAPPPEASLIRWPAQLLVLSARSSDALDAMMARLAQHLDANPHISLADACYTAQVGRVKFPHRRMVVCANRAEAIAALSAGGTLKGATVVEESATRPVAFMFSGQGSQHTRMAHGLYEIQPVFRYHMDFCADVLKEHLGCDLREVMLSESAETEVLNQTYLAQPALFALEYSLAKMWMSWGVQPVAMIGHSIGEYVAACLAEVFSVEDALQIVAARGRIMQQMPPGGMLAVPLSAGEVRKFVDDEVSVAAVNSPSLCTLSGSDAALARVKTHLASRGIECRDLRTSHAFHSNMMDGALAAFFEAISRVKLSQPRQRFVSNLTGTWIRPEEAMDPAYWVRHLRQTVRFAEGIDAVATVPEVVFLEIGPGHTLTTFTRDCLRGMSRCQALASLPHPKDPQSDVSFLVNTTGKLWQAGVPINWEKFHEGERLHRVPLPTYFFERQRYHVQPQLPDDTPVAAPNLLARREDLGEWFYVPSWIRSVLPSAVTSGENYGPWLIFSDDGGLGEHAKEILAVRGEQFISVHRGSAFSRTENGHYTIRPSRAEDYHRLLSEMQSSGVVPRSVLYLWSLPDATQEESGKGRSCFYSLLWLAQAFGDSALRGQLDWVIVSTGMHSVSGGETLEPEQSLVLGPAKVIPQEYPHITCHSVDVSPYPVPAVHQQTIVENLLLEPAMPRPWRAIAYRDVHRWEEAFEPARLPAKPGNIIREKGVYLITGGLGGIGLTLAAHLAESAHARLVLTGRTPLPQRIDWQHWIETHGETDAVSQRIRAVEELERLGAEVLPLSVDVSHRAAMEAAIAGVRARFGRIDGVVHSAGVLGNGLAQLKTSAVAEHVLSPKVEGTLLLHSLLKEAPPDFFILCSSISAISPVASQVDYAAANAFMDAFATAQYQGGRAVVISINWDAWQEVGMAVNVEAPRGVAENWRAYVASSIRPAEGVEAFRRILGAGLPQVAVITRDLQRFIAEVGKSSMYVADGVANARTEMARRGAETRYPRPGLTNAFAPAESEHQSRMAEIWRELLGIEEIGIDDNFFELGGHSLLATGILSRVRNAFGISVPLRTIFEAPTIRQLTNYIETLAWVASGQSASADESGEREEVEL